MLPFLGIPGMTGGQKDEAADERDGKILFVRGFFSGTDCSIAYDSVGMQVASQSGVAVDKTGVLCRRLCLLSEAQ